MENIIEFINNFGTTNVALSVIGLLLIIVLFKKKAGGSKKHKLTTSDINAQALYSQKRQNDEQKLTLQEKLELSWKFLYEITEIVINKFSPQDRQEVQRIGQDLVNSGMQYEHVIDLGIKAQASKVQNLEQEKKQDQGRER